MDITYTLSVTVTRAVGSWLCDDTPDELREAAEWMEGREAQREIEKEILQALKKLDGDCDCEVIETARSKDEDRPQNIADTGCDTWEEYRGER